MSQRVLLLLGQMPQDPASGAARSMRTICQMLVSQGFQVHALGTTATERGSVTDPVQALRDAGLRVKVSPATTDSACPELSFTEKGVRYTLLHTGEMGLREWKAAHGEQYDQIYQQELREYRPDAVFTYGGGSGDLRRRAMARQSGAALVFGLRNLGYLKPNAFVDTDAVLTPSEFITQRYKEVLGIDSTPLPTPMDASDVVPAERDPVFITYVNPSPEKGVIFFVRLAETLCTERPDIPILVIEARGTGETVVSAGAACGFDLRKHENLMISPGVPYPRDIYALTRVLLVPSLWEEPSGRVAAEALFNGIPPIVSDRGGLPETCGGGGFVLPIPDDVKVETTTAVSPAAVRPWVDQIIRLVDDESYYQQACERASQAASVYDPSKLAHRYADFFRDTIERHR